MSLFRQFVVLVVLSTATWISPCIYCWRITLVCVPSFRSPFRRADSFSIIRYGGQVTVGQVRLPCNCRIHFTSTNHYFQPPRLCRQTNTGPSSITVTLPVHWGKCVDANVNVKKSTLTDGLYQFLSSPNISNLLNWTYIPLEKATWHAHFYKYSDS